VMKYISPSSTSTSWLARSRGMPGFPRAGASYAARLSVAPARCVAK